MKKEMRIAVIKKGQMRIAYIKLVVVIVCLLGSEALSAQQDPQFTQYMYNTMSVNPGYTGSRENLVVYGLHRTQWVGLDGAPQTSIFSADSPVGKNVGLGLVVLHDELGPSTETYIDANFSYTLKMDDTWKLGRGLFIW